MCYIGISQEVFMAGRFSFIGKTLLFGLFLWAAVFALSCIVFPVKQADPVFFETLITIILCVSTTLCGRVFFTKGKPSLKSAIITGIVWLVVNIAIDSFMFGFGPMKRPFVDYLKDIGLTYLVIPVIVSIFAYNPKTA
jgi:hypothetical protein